MVGRNGEMSQKKGGGGEKYEDVSRCAVFFCLSCHCGGPSLEKRKEAGEERRERVRNAGFKEKEGVDRENRTL